MNLVLQHNTTTDQFIKSNSLSSGTFSGSGIKDRWLKFAETSNGMRSKSCCESLVATSDRRGENGSSVVGFGQISNRLLSKANGTRSNFQKRKRIGQGKRTLASGTCHGRCS